MQTRRSRTGEKEGRLTQPRGGWRTPVYPRCNGGGMAEADPQGMKREARTRVRRPMAEKGFFAAPALALSSTRPTRAEVALC